jgi:hypothetical protein
MKSVALRRVKSDAVDCDSAFGRIDDLPDPQHRSPTRDSEQFSNVGFGRRRVDFLVGIGQLHAIVLAQRGEQGNDSTFGQVNGWHEPRTVQIGGKVRF